MTHVTRETFGKSIHTYEIRMYLACVRVPARRIFFCHAGLEVSRTFSRITQIVQGARSRAVDWPYRSTDAVSLCNKTLRHGCGTHCHDRCCTFVSWVYSTTVHSENYAKRKRKNKTIAVYSTSLYWPVAHGYAFSAKRIDGLRDRNSESNETKKNSEGRRKRRESSAERGKMISVWRTTRRVSLE